MPTLAVGMFSREFTCSRKREHGTRHFFNALLGGQLAGHPLGVSPGNDNSARSLLFACLEIRQSSPAGLHFHGLRRLPLCRKALLCNGL